MFDALWLVIAALLCVVGMAWLALAMAVHWRQVMHGSAGDATGPRWVLRVMGSTALLLSLLACLRADRPSMAALVWVMLLAGAAVAVAAILAWRARLLRFLSPWDR